MANSSSVWGKSRESPPPPTRPPGTGSERTTNHAHTKKQLTVYVRVRRPTPESGRICAQKPRKAALILCVPLSVQHTHTRAHNRFNYWREEYNTHTHTYTKTIKHVDRTHTQQRQHANRYAFQHVQISESIPPPPKTIGPLAIAIAPKAATFGQSGEELCARQASHHLND